MPTEAEFRRRLRNEGAAPIDVAPIDAAAVIRLARRRRLPRRIALGTTVTMAIAGIGVAGISGLSGLGAGSVTDAADGAAESYGDDDGSAGMPAPADGTDVCGSPIAASDSHAIGLAVATDFPDTAPPDGTPLIGSVSVTNVGTTRITGTTPGPRVTVVQDGVVVGYDGGSGAAAAVPIDLGPGETVRYDAEITAAGCGDRSELPPGSYELSAQVGFAPEIVGTSSDPLADVVLTAPGEPIVLG